MNNLKLSESNEKKIIEASNLINASGTAICNYIIAKGIDTLIDGLKELSESFDENYKKSFSEALKKNFATIEIKGKRHKAEIKNGRKHHE